MRKRDRERENTSSSPLPPVSPKARTQVLRLGSNLLYPLSHLPACDSYFLNV